MPLFPPHHKHSISYFWSQVLNVIDLLSMLASEVAISCANSFCALRRGLSSSLNMCISRFSCSQMEGDIHLTAYFLIPYVHLFYIITQIGNRTRYSFSSGLYPDYHSNPLSLKNSPIFFSLILFLLIWLQTFYYLFKVPLESLTHHLIVPAFCL